MRSYTLGAISIFIATFIMAHFTHDSYSFIRIFSLSLLACFALYILFTKKDESYKLSSYSVALISLALYAFIQSYFSLYITTPFEQKQQELISLYYLFIVLSYTILREKLYSLRSYILFILAISGIFLFFILFNFLFSNNSVYTILNYYFTNVRYFNHLQTLLIPSFGLAILVCRNAKINIVLLFVLLLNFMLLIESGGRGTFSSLLLLYTIFYMTNLKNKRVKEHVLLMATLFVLSLLLYIAIYYIFASFNVTKETIDLGSSGRLAIYKEILPFFFEYRYIFNAIGFSPQNIAGYGFLHPHNIFLYSFFGAGLAGMAFFITLLFFFAKDMLTRYASTSKLVSKYLILILFALFIHSLVSAIYLTPYGFILFFYFFLILKSTLFKEQKSHLVNINKRVLGGVFLLLIASVFYLTYVNYKLKEEYDYPLHCKGIRSYTPGILLYSHKIFEKNN